MSLRREQPQRVGYDDVAHPFANGSEPNEPHLPSFLVFIRPSVPLSQLQSRIVLSILPS